MNKGTGYCEKCQKASDRFLLPMRAAQLAWLELSQLRPPRFDSRVVSGEFTSLSGSWEPEGSFHDSGHSRTRPPERQTHFSRTISAPKPFVKIFSSGPVTFPWNQWLGPVTLTWAYQVPVTFLDQLFLPAAPTLPRLRTPVNNFE